MSLIEVEFSFDIKPDIKSMTPKCLRSDPGSDPVSSRRDPLGTCRSPVPGRYTVGPIGQDLIPTVHPSPVSEKETLRVNSVYTLGRERQVPHTGSRSPP